uniref:Probable tocopherol O-methyltransferase, chloroplastic n=1 Tax=Nicotiana sylvestris TaxID=4096 RepID=A0A1U7Y0H3_NICSY|nr:PREDICTED: probable tocopherol O-methyltransferase, chloroplastic [Nicotiana sylvestris]
MAESVADPLLLDLSGTCSAGGAIPGATYGSLYRRVGRRVRLRPLELVLASFQVADALNQPFPDRQFDLVWSMESGEHMPDKQKFVGELGTIILVTWCHRDLSPSEESLLPEEKELLNKICKSFYLPAWCSTADYVKLLQSKSLRDIKATDWSENVAPFWPAVIKSALTWRGFTSILRSGWKTIKAALAMPLMIEGYKKGLIKFVIITCRKPE